MAAKKATQQTNEHWKPKVGDYVIIRARDAGVHAGYYIRHEGREVVIDKSRRLWRWWSEFTLSALAEKGVLKSKESEVKFAMQLTKPLVILDACEIILCTEEARKSLESIPAHTNK